MMADWKSRFRKAAAQDTDRLETQRVPQHVAIIMDGNGRWAKAKGFPRSAGHHAGMVSMRETVRAADDFGVKALTLYAFSTENWLRPHQEVRYLWHLVGEFFRSDMDELVARNTRVTFIGDLSLLPPATQHFVRDAQARTAANSGMVIQFALNYGSRSEIVRAVQRLAERVRRGDLAPEQIDERAISDALDTAGVEDPDLLIRTAGDQRVSNFLLWQIAYTEFYFSPAMWPDFRREHLLAALTAYAGRERRFGTVK